MPGNVQSIPGYVIATWPPPNYDHPNPRWTWLTPFAAVLQAAMTIVVGLRLWLRTRKQAGQLGLDDAMLVPAFLGATAWTALVMLSNLKYGVDRHVWDIPPQWFESTMLLAWLSEFIFVVTTCFNKVSVLFFYRRLTQGTYSKPWLFATYGAIAFTFVYMIGFCLALIFNCRPTEAYWKAYSLTYKKHWTCADTRSLNPLAGALSVFSDLYAVVLPMGMLRHLQAPRRQLIALHCVFSLGLIVVAFGCVRTYYIYLYGQTYDLSWVGYKLFVWSTLELQVALICGSVPALRVFFRQYLSAPLSRAVRSARSVTSSGRGTKLDTKHIDNRMGSASNHVRTASNASRDHVDKEPVTYNATPVLEVDESWYAPETPRPVASVRGDAWIKTPADFEAYALHNLAANRPPRHNYYRHGSDYGSMHATIDRPVRDWYSPPL